MLNARDGQITYFYEVGSKHCLSGAPVFVEPRYLYAMVPLRYSRVGPRPILASLHRLVQSGSTDLAYVFTVNFRFLHRYGFIVNPFAKHTIINTHRCTFMHRNSNTHTHNHTHTCFHTHKWAESSRVCAYIVYAHKHGLVKAENS